MPLPTFNGMVAAMLNRQHVEQALQAQAIRAAVWGEGPDFARFIARLSGDDGAMGLDQTDDAMAAFGLVVE